VSLTPAPAALLADARWLSGLLRRLTGDVDLAADLHQEVAVAALSAPDKAVGRAWLATVARNLAALARRRASREHRRRRRRVCG
jgi:DNA-directed RNA polymerase specialized sigma24 family protein